MLIDTHCHLDDHAFDTDRAAVVAAAQAAGVGRIVVPAVLASRFADVAATVAEYPICLPAYGLHPIYADRHQSADLLQLEQRLSTGNAVAVGEIGLDGFDRRVGMDIQRHWFDAQLAIAETTGLPVLLHARHAVDGVIATLRRHKVKGGIVHAFNGSIQQAQQLMDLGFYFGFGGAFTWPRATRLQHLALNLPLERIVLETDAPDMSPVWARGERNQPAHVARVAAALAAVRNIAVADVESACLVNTRLVLGDYV